MRISTWLLAAAVSATAAGCGGRPVDRSILYSGVGGGFNRHAHVVSDAEARRQATAARRGWLRTIRSQAREHEARRFRSPAAPTFTARLEQAARLYRFDVRRVILHRPRELAPEVTIESNDFTRVSRALGQIIQIVDPAHPAKSNTRAYEGVLIEAVDQRGVPYSIAFNSLRGQIEGGQWARAEALYPFAHG